MIIRKSYGDRHVIIPPIAGNFINGDSVLIRTQE